MKVFFLGSALKKTWKIIEILFTCLDIFHLQPSFRPKLSRSNDKIWASVRIELATNRQRQKRKAPLQYLRNSAWVGPIVNVFSDGEGNV